jgi:hypothetical protein
MKNRTFVILAVVVAFLVAGTLALRGEGGKSIAEWFVSLHGRPGGH